MRTLIVAQGLEYERILAAVNIHSPNKIIVLRSKNDVTQELSTEIEKHTNRVKEYITSERRGLRLFPFISEIDTSSFKVDFFDISLAVSEILTIIKGELDQGNEVHVDISSGNKIIAISLFLAAQALDVPVTYCTAGKYATMEDSDDSLKQIAFSVQKSLNLQKLPLFFRNIDWGLLEKLSTVGEVDSMSKLLSISKKEKTKSNLITISREIDLLEKFRYVTHVFKGRSKRIKITEAGKSVIDFLKVVDQIQGEGTI